MVLSVLTVMEPAGDRTGNVNKGEDPTEDKAAEETPGTSTAGTPRRALRDRGAGRPRSGVTASVADVNGGTSSPQTSGRVLRDRSTRAVPAWLKDTKSSDDDEDEPSSDAGATKRRKVSNSRRKKNSDTAGSAEGYSLQGTEYVFVFSLFVSLTSIPISTWPPHLIIRSPPYLHIVSVKSVPVKSTPSSWLVPFLLSVWEGWSKTYLILKGAIFHKVLQHRNALSC